MALSIGVNRGSKNQIGKSVLTVKEIRPGTALVTVNDGPPILLTGSESTEVLPQVFVFVGVEGSVGRFCDSRLAFEAPRSIVIYRIKNESIKDHA